MAGEPGGDDNEGRDPLRVREREVDCDPAALREADERGPLEPDSVQYPGEVVRARVGLVGARRAAEAALI